MGAFDWTTGKSLETNDVLINPYGELVRANVSHVTSSSYVDYNYAKLLKPTEFFDNFSGKPDGPVIPSDSGHLYSSYSATSPNGIPTIKSGRLTYNDSDYLGGYATVKLKNPVVRVGASFSFTSWSTGGGLACLAVMEEDIRLTQAAGQGVPRSPLHLIIAPDSWSIGVFTTKGSSLTVLRNGLFTPNLTADSNTIHHVEAVIDTDNNTVYVTLPNGEKHVVTDPAIGVPANYTFIEPYRDTNAAGKTKALFKEFWADSYDKSYILRANSAAKVSTNFIEYFPGSQSDMVLNTTATKLPGSALSYVVPDSKNILITVEGLLDVTAAGPVYFGIIDENNAMVAVRTVATKVTNGRFTLNMPLFNAGAAGQTKSATMCAYLGGTAAATLLLGTYGTPAIYAGASLTITPL